VAPGAREAWLAETVRQGCDVLLCHSGLVEVGLDLLAFPTIICYEVIFSTSRWRQAVRRSWRPGQTLPVRVAQFTYEQTMEARGLKLIATKALSSLLIEGKLPSEGLAAHAETSGTTSLIMELFEQVLDEERQEDNEGIVESVRRTFLDLAVAERETERYIDGNGALLDGADGADGADDTEDEVDDGAEGEDGWPVLSATAIAPLPAHGELVAVSLFGAPSETTNTSVELISAPAEPQAQALAVGTTTPFGELPSESTSALQPPADRPPAQSWDEARARQASILSARRAARSRRVSGPHKRNVEEHGREPETVRIEDGAVPSLWSFQAMDEETSG
jgi:hypothetical protein